MHTLITLVISLVSAATFPLERRKDFYTTHEEHGHLPGPRNPPPRKMIEQFRRMLSGENPFAVLNSFNEEADEKYGARFGRGTSKTGRTRYMDALGFSDIPFIGRM